MTIANEMLVQALSAEELKKRSGLAQRKPYIAAKLAQISEMEEQGQISPIIRLEKSYLCNFQCTHCSAEYYMDRHLKKVVKVADERPKMDLDDVRHLSEEADKLGLARFVITGGEPLVMKDFDQVVAALDPEKHYIITDTNGWFLDNEKAHHLKNIGVEKVQLSLDSFDAGKHDDFRNKPGSYKRVMRAIDACLEAELNLILSTVLIRGQAVTDEFEALCQFATERGIGLYISYAKPTGSCTDHPEFVIAKEDADIVRQLEKKYKIFTHMTPSYGSFKGCITTKGIITVTSTMEVTPCPYIDMSIGNLRDTPLKDVLDRGMRNPWMGSYRPDCIIGEDPQFIRLHMEKTKDAKLLPLPYGQGFSDEDSLVDEVEQPPVYAGNFDQTGRCSPLGLKAEAFIRTRRYFNIDQPEIDLEKIYQRISQNIPGHYPDIDEFKTRYQAIIQRLEADADNKSILNGVHVPFMIPKMTVENEGELLENVFLPGIKRAYSEKFPDYDFKDHHIQPLDGLFSTLKESRHHQLLSKIATEPVVGIYFPAMREFSVPAALEKMAQLPDYFMLAGGIDTAATLIANPELLFKKDGYPPLLWLAALHSKDGEGHYFEAYGYDLCFNRRMHFDKASEYSTCALVVVD